MTAARIDAGARDALLEQERVLRYPDRFTSNEALELGRIIARLAREYDRGITATITRESDNLTLLSYSMDDKTPRNALFAAGKRAAAKQCGHASLMCFVMHELDGSWDDLFRAAAKHRKASSARPGGTGTVPAICPAGGAFPIRVGDSWVATLAVSGLHDGLDHELCVRALSEALDLDYDLDVPAYRYPAL